MRFFGFGKRRIADLAHVVCDANESRGITSPTAPAHRDLVVYGTSEGARCRQVRTLLAKRGYAYQDVRVDEDLSMRSWLQRTTGDDALPKVFIGPKCYGGFEDIQVLVFDGRFDRILRGEADEGSGNDEMAALKRGDECRFHFDPDAPGGNPHASPKVTWPWMRGRSLWLTHRSYTTRAFHIPSTNSRASLHRS